MPLFFQNSNLSGDSTKTKSMADKIILVSVHILEPIGQEIIVKLRDSDNDDMGLGFNPIWRGT